MNTSDLSRNPGRLQGRGVPRQRRRAPVAHPRRIPGAAARVPVASGSATPSCSSAPRGSCPTVRSAATTTTRASSPGWSPPGRKACRRTRTAYVVCTGGGGGIMEAANRGASEAGRQDDRPQHRPAARAAPESLHHARARVRVPLLLHAQALVRAPRARARRVSRRIRHARRVDGDPHADADAQDRAAHSGRSLRIELLERDRQLRRPRSTRNDRRARISTLFAFADDPATALRILQEGIEADLKDATPAIAHSRAPAA